ncbi:MAG: hypothetical protein IJ228_06645 [Succinivibrio sp.]|nr:hypothetical protein [Succinivibrio sp.]
MIDRDCWQSLLQDEESNHRLLDHSVEDPAKIMLDCATSPLEDLMKSGTPISFWETEQDHQDAMIAMTSCRQEVRIFEGILIDEQELEKYRLCLDRSAPGQTPYQEYRERHVNVLINSSRDLLALAALLLRQLYLDQVKVFQPAEVENLLLDKLISGKLVYDELNKSLRTKLAGVLYKQAKLNQRGYSKEQDETWRRLAADQNPPQRCRLAQSCVNFKPLQKARKSLSEFIK